MGGGGKGEAPGPARLARLTQNSPLTASPAQPQLKTGRLGVQRSPASWSTGHPRPLWGRTRGPGSPPVSDSHPLTGSSVSRVRTVEVMQLPARHEGEKRPGGEGGGCAQQVRQVQFLLTPPYCHPPEHNAGFLSLVQPHAQQGTHGQHPCPASQPIQGSGPPPTVPNPISHFWAPWPWRGSRFCFNRGRPYPPGRHEEDGEREDCK